MINRYRRWRHARRLAADWSTLYALRNGCEHFGYDLSRSIPLRSGRLYPTLTRLEQHGDVETGWEDAARKLHPRRWYRLTADGRRRMEIRVLP